MSKRIFKYTLPAEPGTYSVSLISLARFLSCAVQGLVVSLWFEVDTAVEQSCNARFSLVMTGYAPPEGKSEYIAPLLFDGGEYVLHLYRRLD